MKECVISYDGLSRYDGPVFVTERTLKIISLAAREKHEKQELK